MNDSDVQGSSDRPADGLIRLVERCPPASQRLATHEPWHSVEQSIGTVLPVDYKAFVDTYGFVRLDDFLMVFSPFTDDGPGDLLTESVSGIEAYRTLQRRFPADMTLPAFPEPGGILPLGRTDNGDDLHWLTLGPPDEWPIVIFGSRERRHQQIDRNLTGLLVSLLDRDEVVPVFPDRFPRDDARFDPVVLPPTSS